MSDDLEGMRVQITDDRLAGSSDPPVALVG
jgi:hypothetical protein